MNNFPGTLYSDIEAPKLPAYKALEANFKPDAPSCGKICADALHGCVHGIAAVWSTCPPRTDLTSGVARSNFIVQAGVVAFANGTPIFTQHSNYIDAPLPSRELQEALESHPARPANQTIQQS